MIGRLRALLVLAALALCLSAAPRAAAAPDGWRAPPADPPVKYWFEDTKLTTLPGETWPRLIQCRGRITWRNTSPDSVSVLYLHLYMNAFSNSRSSYLREKVRNGGKLPDDMKWGGCEMEMTLDGQKLDPKFVQPDDGNADDRTVVRVALPRPVDTQQWIVLKVDFRTILPRAIDRAGAWKDAVFAAQWYPKLGRYVGLDPKNEAPNVHEGWYCPQFHAGPEFAADFADYDLTLTLPAGWKLGATGEPETAPPPAVPGDAATRTEKWKARGVIDFAWTAARRYEEEPRTIQFPYPKTRAESLDIPDAEWARIQAVDAERRRVRASQDVPESDMAQPPVEVRLLYPPEHADQVERTFSAARIALGLYSAWFGPYPYPRLTIVDPAFGCDSVGGMEYPTLVTTGARLGSPFEGKGLEEVTIHEIGHQWFMNLLASNESKEAWLDEGLNSYFTARAMALAYGSYSEKPVTQVLGSHWTTKLAYEFPGLSAEWPGALGLPAWAQPPELQAVRAWRDWPALAATSAWSWTDDPILERRRGYLRSAGWDEMVRPGWTYVDRSSYGTNAYSRPVLLLETFRRATRRRFGADDGERRFVGAFREYAREQRFGHPSGPDLLRALRDHAGLDPAPLWDALARSTGTVDYVIEKVEDATDPELVGSGAPAPKEGETPPAPRKRTSVLVRRRGEVVVPQVLRVVRRLPDGSLLPEERALEPGAAWERMTFDGELTDVRLDPDRVYLQDVRLSDNVWTETPSARPGVKWGGHVLLWLENALATYGQLL